MCMKLNWNLHCTLQFEPLLTDTRHALCATECGQTLQLYIPTECTIRGALDALVDRRVHDFIRSKDKNPKNNFVLKNTKRYGDLTPGKFRMYGHNLRTDEQLWSLESEKCATWRHIRCVKIKTTLNFIKKISPYRTVNTSGSVIKNRSVNTA